MNYNNNRVKVIFILKLLCQLVERLNDQSKEKLESVINSELKNNLESNIDYKVGHEIEEVIENNEDKCEHIPVCECATEFYNESKLDDSNNTELINSIDSIIGHNYIKPMNKILYILKIKGLIKVDIYFIDGKETRENVNIVSVNNYFVEIFDPSSGENIIIPINQISVVRSKSGLTPSIPESALIAIESQEDSYCELSLEEYFKNNIGNKVVIQTVNNLNSEKDEITAVGKGIVVLNDNLAIVTSKIRAIKIEPKV
jgi:hypothetical protein